MTLRRRLVRLETVNGRHRFADASDA